MSVGAAALRRARSIVIAIAAIVIEISVSGEAG
jgi:hypothetical protein